MYSTLYQLDSSIIRSEAEVETRFLQKLFADLGFPPEAIVPKEHIPALWLTDGRKRTHWIWFIFPQLAVLGRSANAKYYGISGYDEAEAYLEHPILGARLREITRALLQHRGESAVDILGGIDAVKVRSCMTLFDAVSPDDIFQEVLDAFYGGTYDKMTLDYM